MTKIQEDTVKAWKVICDLILENRRYPHNLKKIILFDFCFLQRHRNELVKFRFPKLNSVGNTALGSRTS